MSQRFPRKIVAAGLVFCFLLFIHSSQGIAAPRTENAGRDTNSLMKASDGAGSGAMEKESPTGARIKKSKFPWALVIVGAVFVGAALYFLVLKGEPDCTVTVNASPGINATPAAGTQTYKRHDLVSYSFTLQSGYKNLKVTLDGVEVESSGTLRVKANHVLAATATPIGTYTSIVIRVNVTVAGTNFRSGYVISADDEVMVDETFDFHMHSDAGNMDVGLRLFTNFNYTISNSTSFILRQEAYSTYTQYYPEEPMWVWPTTYNIQVLSYTYSGGEDPGTPTLAENPVVLKVAPFTTADFSKAAQEIVTFLPSNVEKAKKTSR